MIAFGVVVLCLTPLGESVPRAMLIAWVGLGGVLTFADAYIEMRRKRPRQRMLELAVMTLVLVLVFAVMAGLMYADGASEWWWMATFAVGTASCCGWSFWRWRQLKADAETALAMLKIKRLNRLNKNNL